MPVKSVELQNSAAVASSDIRFIYIAYGSI